MPTTDTVVIGAGHAGLAVSRLLRAHGRDHVVLERGRVGERWRTERWDSLHLLSPNWMTRLPGCTLAEADPDGFLPVGGLVHRLEEYAASFAAPVVTRTLVRRVTAASSGYRVVTDSATWHTRHVVIATGPYDVPRVPDGFVRERVVTANRYRNPEELAGGGVLVVGASASGVQIADELVRAGRNVVLAVGRHTRMPRRYRGRDVFHWLDTTGRLARTIDEMSDPTAARTEPSFQLVGSGERQPSGLDLDLAALGERGVRLVGRVLEVDRSTVRLGDNLEEDLAAADRRLGRFLDSVDCHVRRHHLAVPAPAVRPPTVVAPRPPDRLDLRAEGITSVVVAVGYQPSYPWLDLPLTAPTGHIRQYRGRTDAPGVYVVGQRFQHRRDSAFIDGARYDARDVVGHLLGRVPELPPRELAS